MDFYDVVNSRRTIRDFTTDTIPEEVIERIISAGMKAPTNDHMRDWHFIVITDKSVASRCIEQIPVHFSDSDVDYLIRDWHLDDACQQKAYRIAVPKQHRMLLDASCLVIPLLKQKTDILHPENFSHLNGYASIWCCIENMFLATTAEGLGATLRIPLGDEAEWVRNVLGFPEDYLMPCFIAIGKPKEDAAHIEQKPISLHDRIHKNHW